MKKLVLSMGMLLSMACMLGQTIVTTTPENKKVILEEFTGINCVFCPDGHAIAQAIQSSNPDDVFLINIHQGGFAVPSGSQPDFRTPFGDAIANQTGLIGYPAGTVNRHFFPGQSQSGGNDTAMSRGQWASGANQTMGEASYVNMAVEASVDVGNSEIEVHVEAFYTGDSPEASNFLNVALLQNNTLGPQTGGNSGNNYLHEHRLIHMVTGQWGEEITTTTDGSFIDRTYNYSIPADYNGVPVVLADLELVVFMTETTQEIISGNGAYPSYSNLPLANDTNVQAIADINDQCGIDFGPRVTVQNTGNNDLTSIDFEYSINSETPVNWTWTGNIASYQVETIQLPPVPYTLQATNTVDVSVSNDDDNSNNDASGSFGDNDLETTNSMTLLLNTDDNGDQTTWTLRDPNGDTIASGGPYGNNQNINETFPLPLQGCHEFSLIDTGGNGAGSVVIYDSESTIIYQSSGDYGDGFGASFITESFLGLDDEVLQNVVLYPNPATTAITLANAENANIQLFDILGKSIFSETNISATHEISLANLQAGTYFVQIEKDNQVTVEKIIVTK